MNSDVLYELTLQSFRLWHTPGTENPLCNLQIYRQFLGRGHDSVRKQVNAILDNALAELRASDPRLADLIQLRFVEQQTGDVVANRLAMSTASLGRLQKDAIMTLSQILLMEEERLANERQLSLEAHLAPSTYSQLFGVEQSLQSMRPVLQAADGPWILSLEGIGGIGKTALADALVRWSIQQSHFEGVGWVSAKQSRLQLAGHIQPINQPALSSDNLIELLAEQLLDSEMLPIPRSIEQLLPPLTKLLRDKPHLIVVDNLETLADLHALLPTLQRLSKPTKFILTTRTSIHDETATFNYLIPQLGEADAFALIRHEASQRNQPQLVTIPDKRLQPIYDAVGGNPLALRLIVGQTRAHSLDVILENLREAEGEAIENLYTFIYRYAWDHLDDLTRRAFIAMPLVPETGGTLVHIQNACELESTPLLNALNRLVELNLINHQGDLDSSKYTIHSLTRTFLLKQVSQWEK